jgi:hypothetical protein
MARKRLLQSVGAVATVVMLAMAGALPSRAGSLEWTDPPDDAKDFLVANTPLPSEATLDIVKVTMKSDDKNLTWSIHVKKLAAQPSMSLGSFFRFNFTYDKQGFAFRIGKDPAQSVFQFRSTSDQVGLNLPCDKCEAKYDLEGNKVTITVPIASMAAGIKAADSASACPGCRSVPPPAALPPLTKGAELTGLNVNAQRYFVRVTPNADTSVAPEGSSFIL